MISVVGIHGTISPEAARIRWIRLPDCPQGRAYKATVDDGDLLAVVSHDAAGKNGCKLWHISVSHRDKDGEPDRVPTWDELKHAFYRLVQEDVPMVLIFPRRTLPPEQYVDIHPTTLHLWESTEEMVDQ